MKKYILAHPAIFVCVILLGIVTQGMGTAISLFIMFIIDSITSGDMASLIRTAYLGGGFVLLFFLSLFVYTRLILLYSYKTTFRLKNDIFAAILGTKISDFSQSNSGKYISIINNDIKMVDEKYIQSILALSKDISTMVFALAAMAFLSPVNALIALVLSSSPLILPAVFGKKLSTTNMAYMGKMEALNEKVKDFLHGFEVIKTFGIEKNIRGKFSKAAMESEKSRYDAGKVSVKLGAFSGTILIATQILTYLVAGYFVITGSITIGAVIAIAGLSSSIMTPIQWVSLNIANIKSTTGIREGLLKVMQPKDSQTREKQADFNKTIRLENLSFSYEAKEEAKAVDPDNLDIAAILAANGITGVDMSKVQVIKADKLDNVPPELLKMGKTAIMPPPPGAVLKNISYTFRSGRKYAIVGGSGSGKSTLLKILMGYYDNYAGNVLVGENEIRDINRENLYESLSVMHQNVFMLDDTLRNNITLYNAYSDEDYAHAITKSKLSALGAGQNIGEDGNTLSGGERQRVAIARALIKNSKIIIMDEAMANLDNETAYEIEKSLLETPELTCIFTTHRYTEELLRQCDGILVMRDGQLIETGTFDELYAKKEYFYSLYNIR